MSLFSAPPDVPKVIITDHCLNSQVPRCGQPIRRRLTLLVTQSFQVCVVRTSHASGTRLLSEQVLNFNKFLGTLANRFSDLGPITTASQRVKLYLDLVARLLKANVIRYKISFPHLIMDSFTTLHALDPPDHMVPSSKFTSTSFTLEKRSSHLQSQSVIKFIYDISHPLQVPQLLSTNNIKSL